jgi:hypothetical protein
MPAFQSELVTVETTAIVPSCATRHKKSRVLRVILRIAVSMPGKVKSAAPQRRYSRQAHTVEFLDPQLRGRSPAGVPSEKPSIVLFVRTTFRWLSAILFILVVVQVAFAAFGAFDAVHKADKVAISKKTIEDGFNVHGAVGTLIVILMLLLLIVAAAGRLGPALVKFSAAIFALGVIQFLLGVVSTSAPAVGILHGLNALLIFSASGLLAHRMWAGGHTALRGSEPPAAAA